MESASLPSPSRSVTERVRRRVQSGEDRLWRFDDFSDLPAQAVGQALSRLKRSGELRRLSKGVYYRPRQTPFGESRPSPVALRELAAEDTPVFPAGLAAANLLGLSTQSPARAEMSTTVRSLPRKLVGEDAVVHTRRPRAWSRLNSEEAALLECLRDRCQQSELSPGETVGQLLTLLQEEGRFKTLAGVADTEPPRVRAMLGALGDALEAEDRVLKKLRQSLNPLSKFNFGVLVNLPTAEQWQAKGI